MRKGQGSVELMVLMAFMFVALASFFLVVQTRVQAQQRLQQEDLRIQLADLIEQELILASRVEIGYWRSFEVPPALGIENYTLKIDDENLLIIKGNLSQNEYLRFLNVNVSLQPGPDGDVLAPGSRKIIIQRVSGKVLIRKDCLLSAPHDCPAI